MDAFTGIMAGVILWSLVMLAYTLSRIGKMKSPNKDKGER